MQKNKVPNRLSIVIISISLIFIILILRLGYLQTIKYPQISAMVARLVDRETVEKAKRGNILDANGRRIAITVRKYSVFLDPRMIKDFNAVKKILASNGISLRQKNLSDFGKGAYFPVASDISEESVQKIRAAKLKGIGFEKYYVRQYPEGAMTAHILGIVDKNSKGAYGIEQYLDSFLAGTDVRLKQARDGAGNLTTARATDQKAVDGLDVKLTIDMNIQFIVEQELKRAFAATGARKAAAIVQNPKTGEILAMVCLPEVSMSKVKDIDILKNYAIGDIIEPGSTFKIIAFAAALEEEKIGLRNSFQIGDGKMMIGGRTIRDDHQIGSNATVSEIMAFSSNVGTVKIAQKLGRNLFYAYIRKFGFYSLTGIELPGETRGSLSDVSAWSAHDFASISFGQGIGVSALQIINSYSAIANDGVLMKPVLIKEIGGKDYSEVYGMKQIRRVVSTGTARIMRKLLKDAVDFGTGKAARTEGWTVGGKTGTAQKFDKSRNEYSKKRYLASFCAMLPAMDPEIVILVIFDEPRGDYYASSIAAPVFKRIAQRTAQYLNIRKDKK
jgi:cell division protein FtsI (penicillin-binding protein 3)